MTLLPFAARGNNTPTKARLPIRKGPETANVLFERLLIAPISVVAKAKAHPTNKITVVRIAVARFESIPSMPTFAQMAVSAAKTADKRDQVNQFM